MGNINSQEMNSRKMLTEVTTATPKCDTVMLTKYDKKKIGEESEDLPKSSGSSPLSDSK